MKRALLLAVIGLAVASGLFAQSTDVKTADISKAGIDPQRLARIPARMKEFVDSGTVAGAVTLVARHGVVVSLEAVGYQDLETKTPMRADSIFQIRSMTKPITAVGIMILLEEGRLLLSNPVEKYVPEFRDQLVVDTREGEKVLTTKKPSRPITIMDLLTHTSGMPDGPAADKLRNTLAEHVDLLSQDPLEFEPGTKVLYGDAGFDTLGRIEERILRPLGMKDSFFFPPPEKYNRIVSAYKPQNGKLTRVEGSLNPEWQSQGRTAYRTFLAAVQYPGPSWGLFSTASDMAAFYQMTLNGGTYNGVRILSRASVEAMTADYTGDLGPDGYGLGWGVHRKRPSSGLFALESVGAYGKGGIRGTFGWVDPGKDLVGMFMIQQNSLVESEEPGYSVRDTFIAMTYAAIADDLKSTTNVRKAGTQPANGDGGN